MEKETTGCLSDNMEAPAPPADLTALTDQIKVVAKAREVAELAKKARHDAQVAWEESNASLFEDEGLACGASAGAEARLRELTIEAYHATGLKHPAEGVGIREVTKLAYDEKEALKWAIEHKLALQLDKKKFADYAKDGTIEFVAVTTEPQATIATVLVTTAE